MINLTLLILSYGVPDYVKSDLFLVFQSMTLV